MATIKDVARLAGVGHGTVSRVVIGTGSVSPKTFARVKKAIEELNYRPSHAARSLLSGSSQMIGVYIPVLSGTFYTPILQAITNELRAAGLHMVVEFGAGSGDERRQAIDGIEFLIERGCDGLIVMSNAISDEDIAALGPKKNKLVVLNHTLKTIRDQCFTADHKQGGILAARTLLDLQHRKIAAITGPASYPDNVDRMTGFLGELTKSGINSSKVWVRDGGFSPQGGWAAAEALVESGFKFTALFCANDEMAVGVLSYFQQQGISVPHRVSIMGYDDTPSGEFTGPRLTSVHIPWRDIAYNAINALLNRCYGFDRPVERKFMISVTHRASLAKAPAARQKKS